MSRDTKSIRVLVLSAILTAHFFVVLKPRITLRSKIALVSVKWDWEPMSGLHKNFSPSRPCGLCIPRPRRSPPPRNGGGRSCDCHDNKEDRENETFISSRRGEAQTPNESHSSVHFISHSPKFVDLDRTAPNVLVRGVRVFLSLVHAQPAIEVRVRRIAACRVAIRHHVHSVFIRPGQRDAQQILH